MLSPQDNERLTRVGPGTPMGQLFRRYWIPAALSEQLPEPDGPPVRCTGSSRGPRRFPRHRGPGRPRRRVLPAPAGAALFRAQRRGGFALRLSRLEVRSHGRLRRHAVRTARFALQDQGDARSVPDVGGRRDRLDLHGAAGAPTAAAGITELVRAPAPTSILPRRQSLPRLATTCRPWRAESIRRTRRFCTT